MQWRLNEAGYVVNYMVSGPKVVAYETEIHDDNQMLFEEKVRREVVSPKQKTYESKIKLGELSSCGEPWKIYYAYGNWFVDQSDFYATLQKVNMDVATVLNVSEDMEVKTVLWSYMAAGVYCNGELVTEEEYPIYKPIHKKEFVLPLKKGKNVVVLQCETLGVRDTRNIIGLQILEEQEKIRVGLPDESIEKETFEAEEFLSQLKIANHKLVFPSVAKEGTAYAKHTDSPDYVEQSKKLNWIDVSGASEVDLQQGHVVEVRVPVAGTYISRSVELTEAMQPQYSPKGISKKENEKDIYERIAKIYSLSRGERFGFGISNALARKHLGIAGPEELDILKETLTLIDERVDCSDFILCGLIRFIHNYGLPEALKEETRRVLCHYRYWMNMKGADGMCFWSENHSLMFYACAMQVGALYPEEYFEKPEMTGRELEAYGRDKVLQWMEDVEEYGFEEFLSTVYMCVTFVALLNVIDFSEEDISQRATKITDKMLEMLSTHTFKGAVIAPMGRVYREVLYPFEQGAQAMMNLINPEVPYSFGEGWLGFYPTSKYQMPEGLIAKMEQEIETSYTTGNARIILEKNKDYCLTSVASPREDAFVRWENHAREEDVDTNTHAFNKAYNECFHGTTCFGPGVYGYQQHMMYMALDTEAVMFVNHPGATLEHSGMRPGYWNGNGVMPAIKQVHGKIGMIFEIPEEHPIHFTHIYLPEHRFEQVVKEDNWIFVKKGDGMMALWCSEDMTPYNDMLFDCEQRVYADQTAYYGICGSVSEYGDFATFQKAAKEECPVFDKTTHRLSTKSDYSLTYTKCEDTTQYLN